MFCGLARSTRLDVPADVSRHPLPVIPLPDERSRFGSSQVNAQAAVVDFGHYLTLYLARDDELELARPQRGEGRGSVVEELWGRAFELVVPSEGLQPSEFCSGGRLQSVLHVLDELA